MDSNFAFVASCYVFLTFTIFGFSLIFFSSSSLDEELLELPSLLDSLSELDEELSLFDDEALLVSCFSGVNFNPSTGLI